MQSKTQSEICAEKFGIESKIMKQRVLGTEEVYPACIKKDTGEVIWDLRPGCSNAYGECPIRKLEKYAQKIGFKIVKMKYEVVK